MFLYTADIGKAVSNVSSECSSLERNVHFTFFAERPSLESLKLAFRISAVHQHFIFRFVILYIVCHDTFLYTLPEVVTTTFCVFAIHHCLIHVHLIP